MPIPKLEKEDIENIIPNCKVFEKPISGGQKIVYPCLINNVKYAVKFILLNDLENPITTENDFSSEIGEVEARAKRELSIMKKIVSPNLIKIGTIDLTRIVYKKQEMLYYSEEWIDGSSLNDILKKNVTISVVETLNLGIGITTAISNIWEITNVHRDIKPQNIMRRIIDNRYVLLDFGIAFDLNDKSLTQMGFVPGTKIYFSPEQLNWQNKRNIDFRSDLFSLGIVMYQCLTGHHPFYRMGMLDGELFDNIINEMPTPPQLLDNTIPKEVNDIVMRLLSKSPNARYRKCSILLNILYSLLQKREA
jgi:eukaryotic-like serine/threonine-protein kinase